jgi:hypothetical protein
MGALVTRWRTWREKRREAMRERLELQFERSQDHGGAPIAGGYGFKLFALAVIVALVVVAVWIERSGLK